MLFSTCLALLLAFIFGPECAAGQTAGAHADGNPSAADGLSVSLTLIADKGRDRYGNVLLQRGAWIAQNINWTSPDGQSALSAFLAGRKMKVSDRVDAVVLAGPWYSYDHHAWNEAVLATHFIFHAKRFRIASEIFWGIPLRASGYFYEAHSQTLEGGLRFPNWLGAAFVEEGTSHGLERFFLGPLLTRPKGQFKFSAFPSWDLQRRRIDLRATLNYRHAGRK